MKNNITYLSKIIAFAVVNDKLGLITFLNNNLVPVKTPITDEELASTTTKALLDSTDVQKNFLQWVAFKTQSNYKNSTGFTDPGFTFDTNAFGTSGTSSSTTTSTSSGSGFWSGFDAGAVAGLLSSGLNFFGGLQASENNLSAIQAQSNAQIAAAQSQAGIASTNLQAAQLQYQAALASQQNKQSSGMNNTLLIVGIVVGTLLLGTTIYFVTKKK